MSDQNDKSEFISLADAAQQTPYSQEYLSLRARQGKLRAVKRGRNWYTTPGWLDDYLQQVDVSRSDLKSIEVVQQASAPTVSDTQPVSDPVSALKPAATVEADEPFVYHPAATTRIDSPDRQESIGSVVANQSKAPTGSTFSWDDDEPKQIAPTPERALLMANLQAKVDQAIASDEPVIDLDDSALVAENVSSLGNGFVELGMADEPLIADTLPVVSSDTSTDKPASNVNWLAKPALAAAVLLLVLVSNFGMIDKLFGIRRNVTAGFGVVIHNTGQSLIALGQARQERRESRLNTSRQIALPIFQVDASELAMNDAIDSNGTVAGASDTQEKRGFWATVIIGLRAVLGQE